jgi:very-short-patch-repair endonuclease
MSKRIRNINLSDLPLCNNGVDWKNSIGYKVSFVYEYTIGELEIIEHLGQHLIKVKYEDEIFTMYTWDIKHCHLGRYLNYITNNFRIEIGEIFKSEKRDLTILDREIRYNKNNERQKWYKYICNKCQYIDWKIENSILTQKTGCPCCQDYSHLVLRQGVNDIATTEPWMIKYFINKDDATKYIKTSNTKVDMICPFCGKIHHKSINLLRANKGLACVCTDKKSYNEKFIYSLLEQLNIEFLDEVKFDWCVFKSYSKIKYTFGKYDFVIENMKIIIECDGNWHNIDNNISGQTKEESNYIDNKKDELAKNNGYKVIRIDCRNTDYDYIKDNILNSELKLIFDLSQVDFIKCDAFAQNNLAKIICEYYKKHDLSVKDLVKIFKLYKDTVRRYLHKGTDFGWCNYDKSNELSKARKGIPTYNNRVPIKCNELDKYFMCANDFKYWYEQNYNKVVNTAHLCDVCNGKRKTHLGLTFKYITRSEFNTIKTQSPELAYGDFFNIPIKEVS